MINLFYNVCRKSKTNLVQFIREWKITDCSVAHSFLCLFFFLNCGCAPGIDSFMRNVRIDEHQATSNYSWCLSVKERRVMGCLFPERNIAVRIEFPVGTHICTYLCMCTIACTRAKESGDPKWLLPVASVGLMLHKSCHEVLVQLTNTCLSYQEHYFLINT